MGVPSEKIIGRYALFDEIASGGMATVHIGRLVGEVGFSRTVAIKRLHPQLAKDPEFVSMLVDEARLAARIRHPNVVPTLDAVKTEEELFLVMEYVHGESFHYLVKRARKAGVPIPPRYVVPIVAGVLRGLHAAHEAKSEGGQPLEIVHRDVSPQNILVGTDGVPRVFDFGIAKACGRLQVTRQGQLKGKLPYMAPEQLSGGAVGRRVDIYATAVVLWEALAGRRLFTAKYEAGLLGQVLAGARELPSSFAGDVPDCLDDLVMCGLAHDPNDRFATAREMASELERAVPCASPTEIGEWVEEEASDTLSLRAARIDEIESRASMVAAVPDQPKKALGRYELIAELHKSYLGSGWAGRVASGAGVGSLVLVRRVYAQPDEARDGVEPMAVTKLVAAARGSMPLRHERLVPVVDIMVVDDELAIVSQYVEGETLRSLMWLAGIRRSPIPPGVALRIVLELLEGLDYLHSQRLADPAAGSFVGLTADDVLVGTDGHARLLEPGVAGVAATLEPWSRHPKRACYDPPERLRDGVQIDLRADLFTVGVLLWEMLQNRALFTGSNLSEVSEGILSGIIDKLETSPSVPADEMGGSLANVVARALERDETARFQSAREMATAVTSAGEAIASPGEVTQLVERLAVSSLMVQRHRIDGDTVEAAKGAPADVFETIAEGTRGAARAGAHQASGRGAAVGGVALLPPPDPPTQGGVTQPSQGGVTQPSQPLPLTAAVQTPGGPLHAATPGAHFGAVPRSGAAPAEVMPTTILDPDGPTLREEPDTGVRRIAAAPLDIPPARGPAPSVPTEVSARYGLAEGPAGGVRRELPSDAHDPLVAGLGGASSHQAPLSGGPASARVPFSIADPRTGSLADLLPPPRPPNRRFQLLVAAAGIVLGVVVVGSVRLLTLGGGADESAAEQPARPVNDPSRIGSEPKAGGTASPPFAPTTTGSIRTEKTGPDSPTGRGESPEATVDAGTSQPSAEPADTVKPPPKGQRYYPKGI